MLRSAGLPGPGGPRRSTRAPPPRSPRFGCAHPRTPAPPHCPASESRRVPSGGPARPGMGGRCYPAPTRAGGWGVPTPRGGSSRGGLPAPAPKAGPSAGSRLRGGCPSPCVSVRVRAGSCLQPHGHGVLPAAGGRRTRAGGALGGGAAPVLPWQIRSGGALPAVAPRVIRLGSVPRRVSVPPPPPRTCPGRWSPRRPS